MRIAYLDCFGGLSAGMVLAALVDAGADVASLEESLAGLPIGPFHLEVEEVDIDGLRARRATVRTPASGPRRTLAEVEALLAAAGLPEAPSRLAVRCYRALAAAEGTVHGTVPGAAIFHEVGSARAIVGVAGTALALHLLGVERVEASPVPAGHGMVRTEHGLLPVPAPATLELLRGVPLARRDVEAELVTPTGAAIAAALAEAYGPMPAMTVEAVGYGAGPHRLPFRNALRVAVGRPG